MDLLNMPELVGEYSESAAKPCIYATLNENASIEELRKLSSLLERNNIKNFSFNLKNCEVALIFDTEKEMIEFYDQLENETCVYAIAYSEGEVVYES